MSTEAMKWAIELAPPMPSQLVGTLVGLAYHADKKGQGAYPSLARLAAYACKAERSVRRDLRQLQELKLIRPGDPARVAHIPADRRPEVYDLAMERTVPKGRAGDDEGTRTSARTLASSRERGRATREAKKSRSGDQGRPAREDVDVRGDVGVRPDVDVTHGRTWTSQRGDVHVTDGGTWTSAKPKDQPSENRQVNQWGAEHYPNHLARTGAEDLPLTPIDVDGWTLTDSLRRWAHRDGYATHVDLDYETAQFLDHFRSNCQRRANWNSEWQKWIRRAHKWATEPKRPTQGALLLPLPGGGQNTNPRRSTTDERVAQGLAIAAELRALEEGDTA